MKLEDFQGLLEMIADADKKIDIVVARLDDNNEQIQSIAAQVDDLILDRADPKSEHYNRRPTYWIRDDVWARVFAAAALLAILQRIETPKDAERTCDLAARIGRSMAAMMSQDEKEETE